MQRTQRSSGRRREGVPAEHVDVLVGERGEPGRVGAVNIAGGAQLAERGVGVAGVPQHDRVEDQAECAEVANSTSQPTDSGMVGCRPDKGMEVGRRPDSGMAAPPGVRLLVALSPGPVWRGSVQVLGSSLWAWLPALPDHPVVTGPVWLSYGMRGRGAAELEEAEEGSARLEVAVPSRFDDQHWIEVGEGACGGGPFA